MTSRRESSGQRSAVKRHCLWVLPVFVVLLATRPVSGQVDTGLPPFASVAASSFDQVNIANANVFFAIPVVNKGGQGIPFTYSLAYNSSIFTASNVNGAITWTPSTSWGWGGGGSSSVGYVSVAWSLGSCFDPFYDSTDYWNIYTFYNYVDGTGAFHGLNNTQVSDWQSYQYYCGSGTGSATINVSDGSGLTLIVNDTPSAIIYTRSGVEISPQTLANQNGAGSIWDANGNRLQVNSTATTFTDTLGATALTVTRNPGSTQYAYTAFDGSQQTYTVNYTNQSVSTNFGCSGVHEFGPSTQPLVSSISLPNSTSYQFYYEGTPGASQYQSSTDSYTGSLTGRLYRVTLPTGGNIKYKYSGGSNGITCVDGSTATLERFTPDTGSDYWTYAHTETTGEATWTTTVTDPVGNQTDYDFTTLFYGYPPSYETERTVYAGGALQETVDTCYNGAQIPCTNSPMTLPLNSQVVQTTLPNAAPSKILTSYNSYGLPTVVDAYDWGGSTLLRETMTCYASLSNPNVHDRPSAVAIYNAGGNPGDCSGSAGLAAKTAYGYDNNGNVTIETRSTVGSSTISRSFTYGSYGVPATSTDFNGNNTHVGSYECGTGAFPMTTYLPASLWVYTQWNCNVGLPSSVTDANSQATTYSYDHMGRPAVIGYPDRGQVTYTYNDTASPPTIVTTRKLTSSLNRVDTTTLDGLGRASKTELDSDPDGVTYVETGYDALGRVASVTNPYRGSGGPPPNSTTQYDYDALNRPTTVTRPDGNSVSASYSGNCATIKDEASKVRTLCMDAVGRVTSVTEDPNGLNYQTGYSYDALDNLHIVSQSGQTRTYNHDMLSRLTSSTTPEAKNNTRYFSYANSGGAPCSGDPSAVCSRTDERGITTTYVYDALNRLTSKGYSDGTPLVTFQYDLTNLWGVNIPNALGRLVNASTWNGSIMLTTSAFLNYDAMGRVQWYLQCNPDNCGGGGWSTTYTYDFAGDVLTMQHPEGFTLSNTISGAQRITQVSSSLNNSTHPPVLASGITYTPWGALSSLTNGCAPSGSCTNLQETYTYNNRLQPTGVQLSTSSSAYYSLAYNYSWSGVQIPGCPLQSQNTGNNGNVMGYTYTDSQNSGLSHTATYFYDNVNRLVCAQATGNSTYNLDFTYDPYGNMACPATNQYNQGYCAQHGFNSYNQISDSGYIYDAVGDLTQEPGRTSQYDGEQRAVNVNNGSTVSFTYNALGQRVQATWGSNAYDFLFDPNGTWLGGEGSGAVYLGSRPVAFENPATGADFMHVNPLGSTTMETSYNGGVASDVLFYPWGQLWNYAEITNFQFAGTIWMDGVSSSDFANNRLYRYDQGRWLTPDPAGLAAADITDPQSLNLYAYALNKPTTLTDPLGLFEDCPNGVIQDNQCIQGTPSDNDNDDDELPWSDRIIDVVSYYHPPRSGDSPVANNCTPGSPGCYNVPAPCANVPTSPPGASATFNANLVQFESQGMWPGTKMDFFSQVFRTGGTFDYKTGGEQYMDYGNWNYGYVCAATYGNALFCQSAAGMNRMYRAVRQGTNPFGSGVPFVKSPYGDQAADNQQIRNGIQAYQSGCVQ